MADQVVGVSTPHGQQDNESPHLTTEPKIEVSSNEPIVGGTQEDTLRSESIDTTDHETEPAPEQKDLSELEAPAEVATTHGKHDTEGDTEGNIEGGAEGKKEQEALENLEPRSTLKENIHDGFHTEPSDQASGTAPQPSLTVTPSPNIGAQSPNESLVALPADSSDARQAITHSPEAVGPMSPQTARPPTSDPVTTRPVTAPELTPQPVAVTGTTDGGAVNEAYRAVAALVSPSHVQTPISKMASTPPSHSPQPVHQPPSSPIRDRYFRVRTTSNTPTQSPGLDSPASKSVVEIPAQTDGSAFARPASQVLQATNMRAPIETHKLNKDIDPVSGRKHLNNYECFEKLGSGQHGTVKRGRNVNTGDWVAVKIVRRFSKKVRLGKSGDPSDSIKKEVAILKKARHPHVVSLYEVIDDPEYDKVYIVLEFVMRGELVWRKEADVAIGRFEKARMARELEHGYDADAESRLVEQFNESVETRRTEKEEHLEAARQKAREQIESGQTPFNPFEQHASWSREHDMPFQESSRMSRADTFAAEHPGETHHSSTPIYATKALSQTTEMSTSQPPSQPPSAPPSAPPSQPASQPVSRPGSPLQGTMYGSYLDEKSQSDLEYQQIVSQILAEENEDWYYEAGEYRNVPCLTLNQAREAFRDTVLGIEYLHFQGIIHRDIKPANLLWTEHYRVKISDFGVSYLGKPLRADNHDDDETAPGQQVYDEVIELFKTVGTPAFYAPEVCDPKYYGSEKKVERPGITEKIDVWALGVTLFCMIMGRLPFVGRNEFEMYEMIAQQEVVVPQVRLKGVSHTDKTPSNHNKRLDDVLEYEEIDDTLRDLLKRLLVKDPAQRIKLVEVKHHPWVLKGIENVEEWLAETDPSKHSEGKKIEVSNEDVQLAVVGLNIFDRAIKGVQRLGSVFRGRSSRKRTTSNPKIFDSATVAKTGEERRSSLRGDEQIFAALKQSREAGDHPLARSVAASPGHKQSREYFDVAGADRPHSALEPFSLHRPSLSLRSMSTADSMKTVTAREQVSRPSILDAQSVSSSTEEFANTTHNVDQNSSSSSLGGIFSGASRRIAYTFRSRERSANQQSPSQTSRSSSVDTGLHTSNDDYHASPSIGISSAIAAGHVDQPPALREEAEEYQFPTQSSAESFQNTREVHQRRHHLEHVRSQRNHRRSVSYAAQPPCPSSPDEAVSHSQPRPASATESAFPISSSSDQIVSGESAAHSRIPSIVSRASSVSAPIEEESKPARSLAEHRTISPDTTVKPDSLVSLEETISADPATAMARAKQQNEEEAGYNGSDDSSSEDEGLAMA